MRIEVLDGKEGWPVVEALDREVYTPEFMATAVWRDVVWAHADRRIVIHEGERVVCHAGVFFREGLLNGAPVRLCGIGGVMTSPSARKKGCAGAAMKRAAQVMEDGGIDFGLLFCEPHNVKLYGDLGWRIFPGKVHCTQPYGPMTFDMMPTMILPIKMTPADGTVDLCGLPW
jgi:aminoglycoside 2'-N-acetyltransferase I